MAEFGLIETIKVVNGRPVFRNLHVNRLHRSLQLLNIDESAYKIEDRILRLLKYECIGKGWQNFRMRLEVQKNRAHDYMPEISALKWNCVLRPLESVTYQWQEEGMSLTVLPKETKLLDAFCNLKHTDRAIYDAALSYARLNDVDDALVMNEKGQVADASIYNLFIVKNGEILTPSLSDGPVAGVLRELLLTRVPELSIRETSITPVDLETAEEMFLTNVIKGIRWVKYFNDRRLENTVTRQVFEAFRTVVADQFGEHLVEH